MRLPVAVAVMLVLLSGIGGAPVWAQAGGDQPADGLKALKNPDPLVRYKAVTVLYKLGKNAKFLAPTLREMLNDPNSAVRLKVAETLWKLDPTSAAAVVPVLIASLKDKDARVRAGALLVVQEMGLRAKDAAPAVTQALKDEDFGVQLQAVLAVSALGASAKAAIPDLLNILKNDDTGLLEATVTVALSKIGTPAVTPLRKALKNEDVRVRRGAAFALGLMGAKAVKAVPELTKALADKTDLVRSFAAEALGRIGTDAESAVPALQKRLKDSNPSVQVNAALALWRISKDAQSVSFLAQLLEREKDDLARRQAVTALGSMGRAASKAVPALVNALQTKDDTLREECAAALGNMGPAASLAVGSLEDLLKEKGEPIKIQAALALWRIQNTLTTQASAALKDGLQSEVPAVRVQTLVALRQIGGGAKKLAADVVPLVRDPEEEVREPARAALRAIDPEIAAKAGVK